MKELLLGIGLFWFGFSLRKKDVTFFKTAIKVEGKVTACRPKTIYNSSSHRYETVYYPIITYTYNDETFEVTDSADSPYKPLMGQRRQVGINPQNPRDVRVYSGEGELWSWICMLAGILLIFFGGTASIVHLLLPSP